MDRALSIGEEVVGMNSIPEEVKKDERGDLMKMLEDEMDPVKEEEIWRSQRERMDNALAATPTAAGQDPAKVYAVAKELVADVERDDVEEFISKIEGLAHRTNLFAVLSTPGPWNRSLLHSAAFNDKDDILRLLLDYVDDHLIASQDDWGNTPLHMVACYGGSARAAEMLVRRARNLPNIGDKNLLRMKNKYGDTALHLAVAWSKVKVVRYLLSEDLEPVYWNNASQKSPLYLALNADDSEIHEVLFSLSLEPSRIEGLPPIHGAIVRSNCDLTSSTILITKMGKNISKPTKPQPPDVVPNLEILIPDLIAEKILEKNVKLFAMTDSRGGNVFHFAAYLKKVSVFKLLRSDTEYLARQPDMNGDLPIHIASQMGHVDLIEKLQPVSEFLNGRGQTVLHVAAKYGRASTVRFILRQPWNHINSPDHDGNTALHLAAMHSQPAALISLLQDKRILLLASNNECLTAFDIARECITRGYTIRKRLSYVALACSCMGKVPPVSGDLLILRPEARVKEFTLLVRSRRQKPNWDFVKDFINSRMVVATLVATVTFAAGFAVPGGFNGSDTASKDDRGMATMMDKRMFQAFVIFNTIAMFCSMTAVVILIWGDLRDVSIAISAYEKTTLPLKIALPAMSAAFLTGVTLTVGKLPWLANTIFYLGLLFLVIISGARLLEFPPFLKIQRRPIHRLTFLLILAYIYLWRVETYIYDDTKDDGMVSKNSASRPADDAGELKTDDSVATKCGDAPHPPIH